MPFWTPTTCLAVLKPSYFRLSLAYVYKLQSDRTGCVRSRMFLINALPFKNINRPLLRKAAGRGSENRILNAELTGSPLRLLQMK